MRAFICSILVAGLVTAGVVPSYASSSPPSQAGRPSTGLQVQAAVASTVSRVATHPKHPRFWRPDHYRIPRGPTFNNPVGSKKERRRNLTHVIRTINSVPGYRLKSAKNCPKNPALIPAEIKISLYSIADRSFANALIRAHRRCISVRLLMNDHLDATTSKSWGSIARALGQNRHSRSFTYRCHGSCRGHFGVLHSKFYLFNFNESLRPKAPSPIDHVVMMGSSNMTTNAVRVQWNDLFTVKGSKTLYDQYQSIFKEMVPDRPAKHPLRVFTAGRYQTTFWPIARRKAKYDPTVLALRTIHCTGAQSGAGIHGHSLVLINMHAWHGKRGHILAKEVRRLWAKGCYVRILYSFMVHSIYRYLTHGTGKRMLARRTIFSRDGITASLYSHMKMVAVTGHVGADRSAWVTWTGSNNFAPRTTHGDEVMMRIDSRPVYVKYRRHFDFIKKIRSSGTWAIYKEPSGGGRAPDPNEARTMPGATMRVMMPVD